MTKRNLKKAKTQRSREVKKVKRLSRSALVSAGPGASGAVDVEIIFKSGLGQATAALFRNGLLINMQSISTSDTIHFSDARPRDSISINGVCTGTADVIVSVPTNPPTPEHFDSGIILAGYTIL